MNESTKTRYGTWRGQPATIVETWRVSQVAKPILDENGKPTGEHRIEEEAFLLSSAGAPPAEFVETSASDHAALMARTAADNEATRRATVEAMAATVTAAKAPTADYAAAAAEARKAGMEQLAKVIEAL